MRKYFLFFILLLCLKNLTASVTEFQTYDQQKKLIDGEIEGISIAADGSLFLSPAVEKIFASTRPFFWDSEIDSKGNLFIAAGDGAKIFKISSSGKVDTLAQWENNEIYALALDRAENLYAATSPDGKIYRFDKKFQPTQLADLKVKYIWDLIFDVNNVCYAATGDSGKIFKINPNGKQALFFQSEETHIRTLAWEKDAQLLAGTYKNGYLYRIDSAGHGFIIYDSDFEEIFNLVVSPSNVIYAAGSSQQQGKMSPKEMTKVTTGKGSTNIETIMSLSSISSEPQDNASTGILKIQPDGVVKNIWQENKNQVCSIFLNKKGEILVGTGEEGKLFQILPDDEIALLHRFPESQLVNFGIDKQDNIYFITSNLGTIYKLAAKFVETGEYTSPAIDAVSLAQWGTIQLELENSSQSNVEFFTHSGNTQKPNPTWSPWTKAKKDNDHFLIICPKARFLQWQIKLKTNNRQKSPRVKNIKISYQRQNLPPEIISITVQPMENKQPDSGLMAVRQPLPTRKAPVEMDLEEQILGPSTRPNVRQPQTNGYRTVSWKAQDLNKDKLVYNILIKQKDTKNWLTLTKNITSTSFSWDSKMMPDGYYQLKLIASDEKANPVNTALIDEKICDAFIIDNTGPEVKNLKIQEVRGDSLVFSFLASDELSLIQEAQFSFNGKNWNWICPIDEVSDSKNEKFFIRIKRPAEGYFSLVVKITDAANNIGYGRLILED